MNRTHQPPRRRARRAAVLAVSAVGLTTALLTAPATASPSTGALVIGATSSKPLPLTATTAELAALSEPDTTTRTSTPAGFALRNPGTRRSDYIYDSSTVYQGAYNCPTQPCTLAAETTAQFREAPIGGSSHTWELTMTMKLSRNPGNLSWSYSSSYWCGVNVSGGSDTICVNGAAPSGVAMSVNTLVNKPWGATNNITTFSMVQAATTFSNGAKPNTKFRGWDTLSRSTTTKLNGSSDG